MSFNGLWGVFTGAILSIPMFFMDSYTWILGYAATVMIVLSAIFVYLCIYRAGKEKNGR